MDNIQDNTLFLLTDEELGILKDSISSANRIVITAHKSPDGDAVGSTLAWKHYLAALGKDAVVVLPDAAPDFLHWLPQYITNCRGPRRCNPSSKAQRQRELSSTTM